MKNIYCAIKEYQKNQFSNNKNFEQNTKKWSLIKMIKICF